MFTLILGAVIAIATLIFAFQNTSIVGVSFLIYQFEGSLALIIIASLLAGFVVGVFLLMPYMFNESRKAKKLKKEMKKVQNNKGNLGIQYEDGGLTNQVSQGNNHDSQ